MSVSFAEKGGGTFTVRFQVGTKRREFKGKVGDSFFLMAGPDVLEVFTDESKATEAQKQAKKTGQSGHFIPLKLASYEEKIEKIKDVKAGGIEVEVDNSALVVERNDGLNGKQAMIFSTPQRQHVSIWEVGNIKFYTPASGGKEIGPFRLGEIFEFEGKKFVIVSREDKKVKLLNLAEPQKEPLQVPPDINPSSLMEKP